MVYLLVRGLYLVVAPCLAVWLTKPLGVRSRDTLTLFAIGIPAGVFGAHALAVFEPGGATDALGVWSGRSAIFGGYAAGIVTAAAYTTWRGIALRRLLDGCAPVMALGEGMTRAGCFFAGCCYGKPTASAFGITFSHRSAVFVAQAREGLISYAAPRSLPVHPTQLYGALFGFVLCALLIHLVRRRRVYDGGVFCLFLLAYALWRFVLAYLRADGGPPVVLGLVSSQLWSLAAAAAALVLSAAWRRPRSGRDVDRRAA